MKKNIEKPKFLNNSIPKKATDALIPTAENDYSPKALHFKSLSVFVVFLIIFKVFITLFLFVIYPSFVHLSTDIYNQVIELTNKTRIEEGVPPLEVNDFLNQAAQNKAQDMLLDQYFAHDTPEGKRPWQWIDKKEYDYTNAGENLAMNFTSAEVAHLALLQSESHKKNIVNPKFKDIGVAVLTGEMNGKKTMIMVEMFGKQRNVNIETQKQENNELTPATGKAPMVRGVGGLDGLNEEQENTEPQKQENNGTQKQPVSAEATDVARENIEVMGEEIDLETNYSIESAPKEVEVKLSILNSKSSLVNNILKYFDYFMFFGLGFLVLLLALNIFIKIKVQRPAVIFQSLVTIAIIIILITVKFHFIQGLAAKVIIG